jgi:hypothetical protein
MKSFHALILPDSRHIIASQLPGAGVARQEFLNEYGSWGWLYYKNTMRATRPPVSVVQEVRHRGPIPATKMLLRNATASSVVPDEQSFRRLG